MTVDREASLEELHHRRADACRRLAQTHATAARWYLGLAIAGGALFVLMIAAFVLSIVVAVIP